MTDTKTTEPSKAYFISWYLKGEYERLRNNGKTPDEALKKLGIAPIEIKPEEPK